MKHKVTLKNSKFKKELLVDEGKLLLPCIQDYDVDFQAPCGGNGICGKCKVFIEGEGYVISCKYHIKNDIQVILPEKKKMEILSAEFNLTKKINGGVTETFEGVQTPYGIAIDIGTTSLVFYFVDLFNGSVRHIITRANPQAQFGADVISRINFGAQSKESLIKLQSVLINALNKAVKDFCKQFKVSPNDIIKISIVGNTVMLHTFLGVDAISIALAPFKPVFTDSKSLKAQELNININPSGNVLIAPSLSGYIGADIISGLASIDTNKLNKNILFIDIGTNGEVVLITNDQILACATAAGPAFEGANISCGMGAFEGAISHFDSNSIDIIGEEKIPKGICGSGLIDIVAYLKKKGLMTTEGNIPEDFVVFQNATTECKIILTQKDIRQLQLAKAAISAGIKRLLAIADIRPDNIEHILLAGGFGNFLDIKNAIYIGLLPDVPLNKFIRVGNTAGSGALLFLQSYEFLDEMEKLKQLINYIELSEDPEFVLQFSMEINF